MIKKSIYIIILVTIFSCSNISNQSFNLLENAFSKWYFKNHYTKINFSNISYPYNVHIFNEIQLNEYYADLNRFSLELSQIDFVKLSYNNSINYNIINDLINNLSFKDDNIPFGDIFVYISYYSLFNSLENDDITMYDKIDSLFKSLDTIKSNINYIDKLKYISIYNKSNFDNNYNILINYINNIPIRVNAETKTLDLLDMKIKNTKEALVYLKNTKIDDNIKILGLDKQKYKHMINQFKYPRNLNKEYKKIQGKIFKESYPIYIKENDEPIWVDEEDTLDVIRWVVNNKLKNNNKKKSKIIQESYQEFHKINHFLINKNIKIFPDNLLPSIIKKNKELHLFEDLYYLNKTFILNDELKFQNNKYNISKTIVNDFYKQYFTNKSMYKINKLYNLNTDLSYQTAMSVLMQNILLDLKYHTTDPLYKINMYLDIIQIITCTVNQKKLFEMNISKKNILKNLKVYGFFKDNELEDIFNKIYNLDELYLKTFLYNESILNKYKKSDYKIYNKLQFSVPKPYYLIK